jgi:dTDP-4-dehydrorhamnose reductase
MFCNLTQAKNPVSTPTWARTLAEATGQIIAQGRGEAVDYIQEKCGLYHLTDGGFCSRYEWAKAIFSNPEMCKEFSALILITAKSTDFNTVAIRPKNSVLVIDKINNFYSLSMPEWKATLQITLDQVADK